MVNGRESESRNGPTHICSIDFQKRCKGNSMHKQLVLKQFNIYMQREHAREQEQKKQRRRKQKGRIKRRKKSHLTYKNELKMDHLM